MKTPNSVSQKILILLKTNTKKGVFLNVGQLKSMNMKSMSMYSTQYLGGAPFAWITAAKRRGMESISLWFCSGVMRAQVGLIVAFSSSELLTLISKGNAKFTFIREHNFGPLSNSPGKMLLTLSLVQEWLDARNATTESHVLHTSIRGDS
ncbi:hypothetical protein XENOCAPTIV_025607 [Xenoophorus captivus]|uniref:Uncharacterized protein n=1 Tax=Xenoophorus captivus TaxID=1517983 RepID=A0ABV0R299_9TELE